MAQAVTFPSATNGLGIPLLFTGQAQKEFVLNQALATLDAVSIGNVEATQNQAPIAAQDGSCYLVGVNATGAWRSHDNELAVRIGGSWHFIPPQDGMEVYDRAQKHRLFYDSEWKSAVAPDAPNNGSVVDTEARQALSDLLTVLRDVGILAQSGS